MLVLCDVSVSVCVQRDGSLCGPGRGGAQRAGQGGGHPSGGGQAVRH